MTISSASRILIMTGAGISAESGISTFRDSGGLWEKHRIEDVATPEAFQRDPALVWNFYKQRYHQALSVEPNAGHHALVKLEKAHPGGFNLITQNVDGLHLRAGNKKVYEMHGSLNRCYCTACRAKFDLVKIDLSVPIPRCTKCGANLRPDIVWFGEVPYYLYEIENLLKSCDVFVVIGTSGVVYPAAGFVMTAKYFGAATISVNLERPDNCSLIDKFIPGKAGEILPELVASWI